MFCIYTDSTPVTLSELLLWEKELLLHSICSINITQLNIILLSSIHENDAIVSSMIETYTRKENSGEKWSENMKCTNL